MYYSHWCSEDTIKNASTSVKFQEDFEKSGMPVIQNEKDGYIYKNDGHTLIIGSTGSGKTQVSVLPLVHISLKAHESVVINDPKGEIYERTSKGFMDDGYEVICLDFDKSIYGNYWNPLTISYNLYKEGKKDEATKELNNIGYYLLYSDNSNRDPYWDNASQDYFTGLALYLYETSNKEVTIRDIFELSNNVMENLGEYKKKIKEHNYIYEIMASILNVPEETFGGIVSTFETRVKKFVISDNLKNVMSKSSFDLKELQHKKMVIYTVSGYNSISSALVPMLVNQIFTTCERDGDNKHKVNIILEDFDNLIPINEFNNVINYSRGLGLRYTVTVKSYFDLKKLYGKENVEILKFCFANTIYLLSQDIDTLKEISKLCGRESESKDLISVEELRCLKQFEAIFIILRQMPFRTILTPDYKIDWNVSTETVDLPLIER